MNFDQGTPSIQFRTPQNAFTVHHTTRPVTPGKDEITTAKMNFPTGYSGSYFSERFVSIARVHAGRMSLLESV